MIGLTVMSVTHVLGIDRAVEILYYVCFIRVDDYNKLQATLRMHLEKPRELPKVNMRAVRQYEKLPDPPSELELFFKVSLLS